MTEPQTPPFVPYVPGPTPPTTGALPPMGPPTSYQQPVSPAPWTTGALPTQPSPARPSNRGLLIVIAALLGLVVLIGGIAVWLLSGGKTPIAAVQDAASKTYHVAGTLTLNDTYTGSDNDACSGKGGYRDIAAGTQITVTDASGATIAIGQLGSGRIDSGTCKFGFEINGIPAGKNFYGFEISHRGVVKYAEAEVVKGSLQFSLG